MQQQPKISDTLTTCDALPTPISYVYGFFDGKAFVDDASKGFRTLKYMVREKDGIVIALFDEKKRPMDVTPDVYECKHCGAWEPRGEVHFDNHCEPICLPCVAEDYRRRNANIRGG